VAAASLLAALALAGTSPPEGPFDAALRSGLAAFEERDAESRLEEALRELGRAAELRPGDPAAELPLARAQAFRAQAEPLAAREAWTVAARAAERVLRRHEPAWAAEIDRGADAARAAALVTAGSAEALYWLGQGTLGAARTRGAVAVLAVKDVALACFERAAALDERTDFAGPHRALGAALAALPSAAGGGAAGARAHFDRARALAPAYQLTRLREAETLALLLMDRRRFDALLGEVLAFDETRAPEIAPENRLAKRLARELLARRDRLF